MDYLQVWNDIVNGKPCSVSLPPAVLTMLENRVSAYLARRVRHNLRGSGTRVYSFELFYHTAVYYKNYYLNGALRPTPLNESTVAYNPNRTAKTKARYHLHKRFESVLQQARSQYKAQSDDDMILYLLSCMPNTAFSQAELDIWKCIYDFATAVNIDYTAVKVSNHRNKQTVNCTFLEFASWLTQNTEYTSRERGFITPFITHYTQNGHTMSAKQVDTFLQSYSSPQFFGEGDYDAIGLATQQQRTYFFKALSTINAIRKK